MADAHPNPDAVPSFTVSGEEAGGTVTLRPSGELDMATVPELEAAMQTARGRASGVVLDLSAVTFIDSTGVSFVMRAHNEATQVGFRLELVPGPPVVQRVFELVGMAHRLPFRK